MKPTLNLEQVKADIAVRKAMPEVDGTTDIFLARASGIKATRRSFTPEVVDAFVVELVAQRKQLAAVVAENAGLKSKGREVLNEACKVYEKLNATISSDSGDFIDGQTLHEFWFLLDVETPETDAFLAGVRAQGVEMCAENLLFNDEIGVESEYPLMREFAAQLRQGAEHE